ncbi:MAG TPA: hypothetical protein VFZ00_15735 [Solirubrobacter sp.]|jgi:hypothetical protein|nr:hypothetical protein [Solirubrobacter sp.]
MRPRARIVTIAVLAAIALAAVVALFGRASEDGTRIVRERPIAFNLRVPDAMREVEPGPGEWLRVERPNRDSLTVSGLELPAYTGDVNGILPIAAARELDKLKQQFPNLELVEEGKARINKVAGYTMAFRVSRSPREYGRLVLLPRPEPGARDGVKLLLLANPEAGAGKAADVGSRGLLKTPYRSFRFGTEGP